MTIICVSVIDKTLDDIKKTSKICKSLGAKIIEIRLDYLEEEINKSLIDALTSLHKEIQIPFIMTLRPIWEGGKYQGNEETRIIILRQIIDSHFEFIDLELKMDDGIRNELITKSKKEGVKTITSYHDLKSTPSWEEILGIIEQCVETDCDMSKTVFLNKSYEDALAILMATHKAKERNYNYSVMGIGPYGYTTRILGRFLGNAIVYASLDKDYKVMEGQVDISTLIKIWNVLE